MQKLPFILLGAGFLLCATAAVVGWIIVPIWINNRMTQEANLRKLTPTSSERASNVEGVQLPPGENLQETWEEWQGSKPALTLHLKIYFFNVTNAEKVKSGEKPILNEVGPFVYREERTKTDIHANVNNNTIFYKERSYYFFEPEMSSGTEDDLITVVNLPFIGLAKEISKFSHLIRYMITSMISKFNEDIFVTKTVRELTFGGYEQKMLASLSEFTNTEYLPNNTFGFYYGRNGTESTGRFEVNSGHSNPKMFANVVSWNNEEEFDWWKSDKSCSKIEGTEGFTFPPFLTKETTLKLLRPELCRVFPLEFVEETTYGGISIFRYGLPQKMFQDPRKNANNMCFCTADSREKDECPFDGAYSISACRKNASVYISMPHFLYGPEYEKQSEGYHPNPAKHCSFVEIEPNTGTVLRANFRTQGNMELAPFTFLTVLRKVPHVLIPFLWSDETATISEASAAKFSRSMSTPEYAGKLSSSVFIGIGAIIVAIAIVILILRARKRNYDS